MNELIPVLASPLLCLPSPQLVPATIAEAGERRYPEFFTATSIAQTRAALALDSFETLVSHLREMEWA